MIYRPQYVNRKTPAGFEDQDFVYQFDGTNTPLLSAAQAIAAGGQANNILLPLEPDADFICRGIKIALGTAASNLQIQLKTPSGDYISTVYIALATLWTGGGAAIIGRLPVPLEPEIQCGAGGVWVAYLFNPTTGAVNPPTINLIGVKRRACKVRAA